MQGRSEITGIRIGVARTRATYYYVELERTGARPAALPLLLSPQAKALRDALDVLLVEHTSRKE